MRILILLLPFIVLFQSACRQQDPHLFRLVDSDESGIHFANTLTESDTLNAFAFEYIYNGAGVGTADFNNDGLTDIFFAGNLTTCRLYLNKGNLTFNDVTNSAGVTTDVWCTGVSVVDVNKDGLMDIYVSTIHPKKEKNTPNIFFINKGVDEKGIPHFENLAQILGVDDTSYSTQAAFIDYDLDGDLDMYLLNNALENYTRNAPIGQRNDGTGKSVDRLYRHDIQPDGSIHFSDVSAAAGVLAEGWGLGIVVNDFNNDGWPDIYCANDFLSSDHLYINLQDGTFRDNIAACMAHQEFNGMGADMADLNNDGLNDLVVVDMMPDDNLRQKTMFSGTGYDRFMKSLKMKYQPQYIRNVLQRNNGNGTFSDIGYMSGIYATDWSWSALLADFDNDGLRDIFITNGYPKDITDLDFVTYNREATMFGTDELKRKNASKAIQELGGVFKPNFLFHNKGDFQFENVASAWGLSEPTYSNGAAYADLDNDGDLDLILNNLNGVAHLYENTTNPKGEGNTNFLQIRLQGPSGNPQGIGTKIWLYINGKLQYGEQQLQRGYLSSVDPILHFGLGPVTKVDSVVIRWPGEWVQVVHDVPANSRITVAYNEAKPADRRVMQNETLLIADKSLPRFVMPEQDYVDYKQGQATLPHKFSQQGPGLAVGDVNGDGLDDFIAGGTAHHSAKVFFQQPGGAFRIDSLKVKEAEDVGVLLFDADNDGDMDLYCVSGSSEFGLNTLRYQDRLYRNNSKGEFSLDETALPKIESSGSCVIAGDIDKDGDLDLFVGGRVVPTKYPQVPDSYLLRNDGAGKFEDITEAWCPALKHAGMITSALWTDVDSDGWLDLSLVGECMPLTFFKNNNGQSFKKIFESNAGWWNSIAGGDFDNDGDIDFIAGNLGLNSIYKASENEPISVYAKDFDGNGSFDPILTRYIQGKEHPVHYRETMTDQIVGLRRSLKRYADYGKMTFNELFDDKQLDGALVLRSTWLQSSYVENLDGENFKVHALPTLAQTAPMFGIVVCDLNEDNKLDFLSVGNSYASEPLVGYYDAGIGVCALGNGDGTFSLLTATESGFVVDTDGKGLVQINVRDMPGFISTSNQDSLRFFVTHKNKSTIIHPKADDQFMEVLWNDGTKRRVEFYYGSSYLSQSGRTVQLPGDIKEITITNARGELRKALPK